MNTFRQFAFAAANKTSNEAQLFSRIHYTRFRPNRQAGTAAGDKIQRVHFSPALKRIIGAQQQWRCPVCKQLLPASFQIDHIVALHKGGDNNRENLQALCPTCHAEKSYLELYESGKTHIPSSEMQEEDVADAEPCTETESMAVCEKCHCTYSCYFVHMCNVVGC